FTGMEARYVPTGHVIYLREDGTAMAVPFDPQRHVTTGAAVALLDDVSVTGHGEAAIAFADSGTLVYTRGPVNGSSRTSSRLVRVQKNTVSPLPLEPDYFGRIRVSPDGLRLAATTWGGSLWVYDLVRHTRMKLPDGDPRYPVYPAWTSDGRRIAFVSLLGDFPIYWQPADGVSPPELLLNAPGEKAMPAFTPDGKELVFARFKGGEVNLWRLRLSGGREAEQISKAQGSESYPVISPDGRWLAYASSETGQFEVFLQPYPRMDHKTQVSVGGGTAPEWSHDGRTIYYSRGPQLVAVSVAAAESVSIGAPAVVFDRPDTRRYQPLPDGSFIALQDRLEVGTVTELNLVVNWFEELKRLVPRPGDTR
ncbi:MAG: hypothetical protein LC753_19115, partial [Acidobacteria bacterium]|nr:hypothetical protein [Acidobacteriota bacterium]